MNVHYDNLQPRLKRKHVGLIAKEHEPDDAQGDHRDTHAGDKKQQYRRARFGLSRFHRCFDNDAVLFLYHVTADLYFRCEVGTVKHRHTFRVIRQSARRCIFRSTAQRFGACIQTVFRSRRYLRREGEVALADPHRLLSSEFFRPC
jgi:hypothetical protein